MTDANGNSITDPTHIANVNPIRYRGYYYDTETGFYYLQSRYYNPEWCRFLNADVLFIAGDALTGANMFAYCLNNPVMYSDPSGYEPTDAQIQNFFTKIMEFFQKIMDFLTEYFNTKKVWPTGRAKAVDDFPNYKSGGSHHGTDFAEKEGTPVYAAMSGTVITVVNSYKSNNQGATGTASFGNYIVIELSTGAQVYYAHLQYGSILVEEGDYVKAGQQIAAVGNTGNSTGPHLHYAVKLNGNWVNPKDYLPTYS